MLNAALRACPVFGGTVKSFAAAKVTGMDGVKKVVQVGDSAVAVVADTWWHAKSALDALPIVSGMGGHAKVTSASIAAWLKEGLDADQAFVGNQNGDAKNALAKAAKKVTAEYGYPYQNHACMEPMNATALYTPEKCEVWCGTQNGEGAFAAAMEASGLPADKVEVYKIMLGGGFGRRGRSDYVTQAVSIAKQMPGTPVKLLWSREEDMQHCTYHPVTQCRLSAGLDDKGNLDALHIRISGQSILTAIFPTRLVNGMDPATFQGLAKTGEAAIGYTVPNLLVDHAMRNPHVPPGFWRGVNVNQNAIYLECFMDELAKEAGVDPVEFRRKLKANHPKPPRGANGGGGAEGGGKAGARRRVPRYRPAHGLWQLRGGRRRGLGRWQQSEDPPHRGRHRSGLRGQPGANRAADRRLLRLRPVGAVLRRVHREGRPDRADQLRHLRLDAHRPDAEGRGDRHAVGRILGRRGRAHDLRGSARRAQCDLRGDRQTLAQHPAEESRDHDRIAR